MPTQIQAVIFRTANKTWNHSSQSCALCLNHANFPGQLMTQWSVLQCNTFVSKSGGLILKKHFFSGHPEEQLLNLTDWREHRDIPPPPLPPQLATFAWWLHWQLLPDDFTGIFCLMTSLASYAWWLHWHLMPDDLIFPNRITKEGFQKPVPQFNFQAQPHLIGHLPAAECASVVAEVVLYGWVGHLNKRQS